MRKKDIIPVTMENLIKDFGLLHIENDIALLESLKILPALTEARRMSLCLFVGLCTSGALTVTVNEKKRLVKRNEVMIITEESVVNNIVTSDDFDGIGFFVSYKLLHEVLKDITNMSSLFLTTHNHPVFALNKHEFDIAVHDFGEIKSRVARKDQNHRLEVIRLHLLTLIYDVSSAIVRALDTPDKKEKQSRQEHIFIRFIQHVEKHFKEQRQVQWYATKMEITPKHLCEVVSLISRRSPNEWIDKFVTAEMRNLLRHTDMKMSEIAEHMNFPNQSFFGKYFKENVGVSPSDYRHGIEKK